MTQRKTYSRSSSTRNRKTQYKKPSGSKYQPTRSPNRPPARRSGGGAKILLVALLFVIIAGGAIIIIKNIPTAVAVSSDTIIEGITIDGINVAGMSKEIAYTTVEQAAQNKLNNISVTFRYNDKSWTFTSSELQATINTQAVVDQAYEVGKTGSILEKRNIQEETKTAGLPLKTSISVDKDVLIEALKDVKGEIDQPMVEASITFDPSGYDYFADVSDPESYDSNDMFTITPGSVGYAMDYEKALQELNDALNNGWTADITLSVKEEHPKYTVEELEECRTLVFHSSSQISTHNKSNTNRNSNIAKAIGLYKGMVVMPGDVVDYNQILGERTIRNGWLEAPTITQEKTLENALGGGICQASTTIFNAAFMAGTKIIDRGPHSWPAYYKDFGYGMDAMVNWGTDEFIFQNTSDYPIFINTYFWYDSYKQPGYIDVDVYTMPQKDENGTVLHIRAESNIVKQEASPPPIYREAAEGEYAGESWTVDSTLNKLIYVHRNSKGLLEVSVDRVWYKDCVETAPGVWAGGVEVKREHSHIDYYASVAAIIYTKPIPAATAAPTFTPDPG